MTPFDTYRVYLSLKNHFTNPKYDFFKYGGKSKVKIESFNKRRDKYFFEKMSRKFTDSEATNFFLSNFVGVDNPQNLWIGQIINSGEQIYTEWVKRQQSLRYLFKQESEQLFSNYSLKEIFNCSRSHPLLLKKYFSGEVSIETMIIYDKIFGYIKNFDKKLTDPVWETVSFKLKKYSPFVNVDIFYFKKILRELINE